MSGSWLYRFAWLTVLGVVSVGAGGPPARFRVPVSMTGGWTGTADICGGWTEPHAISVSIFIAPDGTVHGSIGDAYLRGGRLQRDYRPHGALLTVDKDWILRGDLDGYLIPDEEIRGARVVMVLQWNGRHYAGGFRATLAGLTVPPVLTARHLRLYRLSAMRD